MLRFAADENFNYDIVRGLWRHNPDSDIVRVQATEWSGSDDPKLLEWLAQENRILLTHDVRTITHYAYERVRKGLQMPGVFEVKRRAPLVQVFDDVLLLAELSQESEWEGQILYLPL